MADHVLLLALKSIRKDELVSRGRFVDCPVCNNHSLKLKRTVQVGRCKSCNETYKIILVYVKSPRKTVSSGKVRAQEPKRVENVPESGPPAWQLPSDSSLFGSSNVDYPSLSDVGIGHKDHEHEGEAGSSAGQ